MKFLHLLILQFFVWRNLNVISEDLWHLKFLLCVWAVSVWIWTSAAQCLLFCNFNLWSMKKYIRSCDLACLSQYHKSKSTLFNIYMDRYHSCYGHIWKRGYPLCLLNKKPAYLQWIYFLCLFALQKQYSQVKREN